MHRAFAHVPWPCLPLQHTHRKRMHLLNLHFRKTTLRVNYIRHPDVAVLIAANSSPCQPLGPRAGPAYGPSRTYAGRKSRPSSRGIERETFPQSIRYALPMYLHTRVLIGILAVTLFALCASALLPFLSANSAVSRETDASLQLVKLLRDIDNGIRDADSRTQALALASTQIRESAHLRHVRVTLVDPAGEVAARTPTDDREGGWLAHQLLLPGTDKEMSYPVNYEGMRVGTVHLYSNPLSELAELEDRVTSDVLLMVLAVLAMAASMYWMVRRGLKPIGQINTSLTKLADGDLDTRLPHFRLKDLDVISDRFNHCAAALQESKIQRRELTRRLIDVAEEERTRVARELHDELGQILTAVKVDAAYIVREAKGRMSSVENCARDIDQLTTQIMDLIRGMLARLRPHGLETMGLKVALEDLVRGWRSRIAERFNCSLRMEGPINSLSRDLNITLYRLIQECLTNAIRHSHAQSVAIDLSVESTEAVARPARVWLRVAEDKATDGKASLHTNGMGLLGMRERVEVHGGEFKFSARERHGVSVEAWLPLQVPLRENMHA